MLHTYTFRGGTRVPEYKLTAESPIVPLSPPPFVVLPMSQHIGVPAVPIVAAGDTVDKGQLIGTIESGLGCPVHASISGRVSKIEEREQMNGKKVLHIVVENDYENRITRALLPSQKN